MTADIPFLYIMLVLPTLFGLTMLGEGVYKIIHYQAGWASLILGTIFLVVVAFGYFSLRSYM